MEMYGRDLHNCMICTCRLVVTAVITDADLLGLHAEKSATVQTGRAEWCCTLWMWRKIRLCNCRRGSGVICCWSCLVLGLKSSEQREPRSGDDLEKVRYSIYFGGELWHISESWKVRDTCRHLEQGQSLTTRTTKVHSDDWKCQYHGG